VGGGGSAADCAGEPPRVPPALRTTGGFGVWPVAERVRGRSEGSELGPLRGVGRGSWRGAPKGGGVRRNRLLGQPSAGTEGWLRKASRWASAGLGSWGGLSRPGAELVARLGLSRLEGAGPSPTSWAVGLQRSSRHRTPSPLLPSPQGGRPRRARGSRRRTSRTALNAALRSPIRPCAVRAEARAHAERSPTSSRRSSGGSPRPGPTPRTDAFPVEPPPPAAASPPEP
jgi:hypothetical protein